MKRVATLIIVLSSLAALCGHGMHLHRAIRSLERIGNTTIHNIADTAPFFARRRRYLQTQKKAQQ